MKIYLPKQFKKKKKAFLITNKINRSCIFDKRLKHVWMIKTIKSDIFQAFSWDPCHRIKSLFSCKLKHETHTDKIKQIQLKTPDLHDFCSSYLTCERAVNNYCQYAVSLNLHRQACSKIC